MLNDNKIRQYIEKQKDKIAAIINVIKKYPEYTTAVLSSDIFDSIPDIKSKDTLLLFVDYVKSLDKGYKKDYIRTLVDKTSPKAVINIVPLSVSLSDVNKATIIVFVYKNYDVMITDISNDAFDYVKNNEKFILANLDQFKEGVYSDEIKGKRFIHLISKGLKAKETKTKLLSLFKENTEEINNLLFYFYKNGFNDTFFNQFFDILLNLDSKRVYAFFKYCYKINYGSTSHVLEDILVKASNILERDQFLQLVQIAYQSGNTASLIRSPQSILDKIYNQEQKDQLKELFKNNPLSEAIDPSLLYDNDKFKILDNIVVKQFRRSKIQHIIDIASTVKKQTSEHQLINMLIALLEKYKNDEYHLNNVKSLIWVLYQYHVLNNSVKFLYNIKQQISDKSFAEEMHQYFRENVFDIDPYLNQTPGSLLSN